MIGGSRQDGRWKIDARFNKKQLIQRIERIADYRHRITLYNLDAQHFLANVVPNLPDNTLLYLDPPYFEKGQHLYENAYTPEGHKAIARIVQTEVHHPWVVTYDECEQVRLFYSGRQYLSYGLRYSARRHRIGKEVMFLSDFLRIPETFLASLAAASGPSF
jgi:DNA adenine methylase